MAPARLRQVVVITHDLEAVTASLRVELGLGEPFRDEGVGFFGLENRVLPAGDCFVEVLTPLTAESAGARYLARRGADGGYMAIFQLAERDAPRRRAAELGVRVVWQADLDDVSGTHLDPRDVGGAIVSLDWADPPESWHWAGPSWQGGAPSDRAAGGITSLTVAAADPQATAARWAALLGMRELPGAEASWRVALEEAGQELAFVPSGDGQGGIVACGLALGTRAIESEIAGVRFAVTPAERD